MTKTFAIGDFAVLKAAKPLPSGRSVKVRVRVRYVREDGLIEVRGVTPGLYDGAFFKVAATELE